MAKLILVSADDRQEFELGPVNTIGRHPDNTIQILDRIISKEHAQILRTADGKFLLRDLGSLNGTYIRGERVQEHVLRDADEISLGSTRLLFVEASATEQVLQRVTIAPGMTESHIRQRISAAPGREFLPEKEIYDIEVLRRDYEKLRIAHELARSVGLEVDLEKLLRKILDKAFELLPADRGVILLMDETGQPVPRYVKTKDGRSEEITLSKSIINEVIKERAAVLSSDATMDSRFSGSHSIIMQGIRSTMCVPLLHADELLGIMHMDSQIATNAFTEKDLQIFTGIANQAAVAIQNARLAKKIENEAKTRAQFQRLLSPNLVEQVVAGQLQLEKGGEQREVTVLFADIRGFTEMSEARPAQDIVSMLNEYFEVMVEVLFRFEGTLDKFVGDEIMALFGAPLALRDAPLQAVLCAVEMNRALTEFNRTRLAERQEAIRVGIGINTGQVVTGAIGSSRAIQYTAIGDPVNTASRLCNLAKPGEILVSETTMRRIAQKVEATALPPMKIRGKSEELRIFNITGFKGSNWQRDYTKPM
ncbi:MAG TPA: adenylate/guanylate cyclase domain-containing protein [Polyangia bacterium]|nr:adenylate/guanylate cyclase domain-containing protein [Polyangia bacterium]